MALAFWIVNPNALIAMRWETLLRRESWVAHRCGDLESFSAAVAVREPAIVLIDWAALGASPVAALRKLKERLPAVSLILTSSPDISNDRIIETLEAGVDDFFPHTIDDGVLKAKLRAHLRRLLPSFATALDVIKSKSGDIKLDRSTWEVSLRGRDGKYSTNTGLTRTEMELLALFLERPGTAMERRFIVDTVWKGEADLIRPGTVDKHVESLRKKLGRLGARIQTVYGVGYAFREES